MLSSPCAGAIKLDFILFADDALVVLLLFGQRLQGQPAFLLALVQTVDLAVSHACFADFVLPATVFDLDAHLAHDALLVEVVPAFEHHE